MTEQTESQQIADLLYKTEMDDTTPLSLLEKAAEHILEQEREIERLRYEVAAIPAIKEERNALRAELTKSNAALIAARDALNLVAAHAYAGGKSFGETPQVSHTLTKINEVLK